jgi:hypothetical protein
MLSHGIQRSNSYFLDCSKVPHGVSVGTKWKEMVDERRPDVALVCVVGK